MATRFLPDGVTYELFNFNTTAQTVMGYVFSSPGADEDGGADQIQRWILFSRRRDDYYPQTALELRPARDPRWKEITDKESFIATARSVFRWSSDRYVKANCAYVSGQSTLTRPLPKPLVLNGTGGGHQADIGTSHIAFGGNLAPTNPAAGFLYTHEATTNSATEFWFLCETYHTPTPTDVVRVGGPLLFKSPETFASLLDGVDSRIWSASCTLMVATCEQFLGIPGVDDDDSGVVQ